jgi:hypothetical protein
VRECHTLVLLNNDNDNDARIREQGSVLCLREVVSRMMGVRVE